ncbi:MAG: GAF domain-containing protein [Anaerolineae bacterium]|nr:GAF domain-containing protein [Anaerolineae bacterium]
MSEAKNDNQRPPSRESEASRLLAQLRRSQITPPIDVNRTTYIKRLFYVLFGLAALAVVVYGYIYFRSPVPQVLNMMAAFWVGIGLTVIGYRFVVRDRLDAAGYMVVLAVVVSYVVIALSLSGIGGAVVVGGVLLVLLVGRILIPHRWPVWIGIAALLAGFLVVVELGAESLDRYPLSRSAELSFLLPGTALAAGLLLALEVLRRLSIGAIRNRLSVAFLGVVVAPLGLVVIVSAQLSLEAGQAQVTRQLESVAALKGEEITTWIGMLKIDLSNVLSDPESITQVQNLLSDSSLPASQLFAYDKLKEHFSQTVRRAERFDELFLLNTDGEVVLSTDPIQENKLFNTQPFFQVGRTGAYIQPPTYYQAQGQVSIVFSEPVYNQEGVVIGVMAGRADLKALNEIMVEQTGLGSTGETYLVGANKALLTESRFGFDRYPDWRQGDAGVYIDTEMVSRALEAKDRGTGIYRSYRGADVIGVYRWVSQFWVVLVAEQELSEALAPTSQMRDVNLLLTLGAAGVAILASLLVTRGIANPLGELVRTATRIAGGELDVTARVARQDEIGELAQAFNIMTARLHDLIDNLERRVEERTSDLEITAELGRMVTGMRDLDTLLPYAVNLIQQRTGHYHVQIFLLDEVNEYAVLRASTGEAGRRLLEAGHRLAAGSSSVIGQVVERDQPYIVHDTKDPTAMHRPNPLLPNTRSEMALPLAVGPRVIGVLDVQSLAPHVFDESSVRVFGLLADQLAIAIDNARLIQQSEVRLREIDALNRRLIGEVWRDYLRQRGVAAFGAVADGQRVTRDVLLTDPMVEVLEKTEVVVKPGEEVMTVAVPVAFRDVCVGVLEFDVEGEALNPETLELAQALADRLALNLENVRLFEQSQRLAQRERLVNEVSGRLTGKTDMRDLLQTAIRELGRALRLPETTIRLVDVGENGGAGQPSQEV